ncbi:hypothetical protein WG906_07975 [Pedobacter sp. P351]|uniref:hypothetical protein n=1 Tax=Pedobacter superstes TaxID=3133441 RepID=UPI0030B686EF
MALKLILTPLLTGVATWAGRRYGHSITGLLIGLPLNAGPIAFFLALENGRYFASLSAKGIILGAISLALYATVYAASSVRFSWLLSALAGWIAYFGATFFLREFELSLMPAFFLTILALLAFLAFFPKYKEESKEIVPPKWDIPVRILLATLFIISLTYVSADLGPKLSGLLSTFPIFGTIFAVTTHHLYGSNACIKLLKGVIVSLLSFSVFFAIISYFIQTLSIGFTFWLATFICLLVQGLIVFFVKKIKLQYVRNGV